MPMCTSFEDLSQTSRPDDAITTCAYRPKSLKYCFAPNAVDLHSKYVDFGSRSRCLWQGQVIASHRILCNIITYPCLRYPLLALKILKCCSWFAGYCVLFALVPLKKPWMIWINYINYVYIMYNVDTTKHSTPKPCVYLTDPSSCISYMGQQMLPTFNSESDWRRGVGELRQPRMLCCRCLPPGSLHELGAFGSLS